MDFSLVDHIPVNDGIIYTMDWNPKYNIVACGTSNGTINIFEMNYGKQVMKFHYHTKSVACLSWNKFVPTLLLSSSQDGSVV